MPVKDYFWGAASSGSLELQRCVACSKFRYFPSNICPHCLELGGDWVPASGDGRIYSFTVIHHPPDPALARIGPYLLALVDLDEGVRVLARLKDMAEIPAAIGMQVAFAGTQDDGYGAHLVFQGRKAAI
jgi:uncharacterized OB-fold protein